MSLTDTIHHHEDAESYYARVTVRAMQKGRCPAAVRYAEESATHRHLAYEYRDTQRITMDAFADHYGMKR